MATGTPEAELPVGDGPGAAGPRTRLDRALATVERWGNRLPDPAILFVFLLVAVWIISALLATGLPLGLQASYHYP